MSHHDHAPDAGGEHASHHVVPMSIYIAVFGALLFLTVFTVAISRVDLGPANMLVAMVVASIKATLVCLFFMQLKYDDKLNAVVFVFGAIFLSLFFIFTIVDTFSREYIDPRLGNERVAEDGLRELKLRLEAKRGVAFAGVGIAPDYPAADEKTPPPPPPIVPDGGLPLPDGGLIPVEGSLPASPEPGSAPVPGSALESAAPDAPVPASAP